MIGAVSKIMEDQIMEGQTLKLEFVISYADLFHIRRPDPFSFNHLIIDVDSRKRNVGYD